MRGPGDGEVAIFDLTRDRGCPSDVDGDGDADIDDIQACVDGFTAGDSAAEINEDGTLDIEVFVLSFGFGCN